MDNSQSIILVVDDNNINRALLGTQLKNDGYQVWETASGEETLALVAERQPDLILLDVMMPGMSGFEVTKRLKEDPLTQAIPIIMVTALEDQQSRLQALAQGAEEFVSKPVHRLELLTRVRNLLKLKKFNDFLASQSDTLEKTVAERTDRLEQANLKLSQVQERLIQAEKLASIGQLAAGVAHEINNPIGFVNSNLGSLRAYVTDLLELIQRYESLESLMPPQAASDLAKFKAQIDLGYLTSDIGNLLNESEDGIARVKKIIQDLKDFSRADSNQIWELADVEKSVDAALTIVHNELKYKADVIKEYCGVPEIECIPSQLSQVFLNLLVNAGHAVQNRGSLGTIRIATRFDDDWVSVAVSDDGCGIPPDALKRVFEPFFTTKPVGVGTGLGLSVSHGIVQRHGGRIEVSSEVGKGTTFTVLVPRKQTLA